MKARGRDDRWGRVRETERKETSGAGLPSRERKHKRWANSDWAMWARRKKWKLGQRKEIRPDR